MDVVLLYHLIMERSKADGSGLFTAFIDYQKAFDAVHLVHDCTKAYHRIPLHRYES